MPDAPRVAHQHRDLSCVPVGFQIFLSGEGHRLGKPLQNPVPVVLVAKLSIRHPAISGSIPEEVFLRNFPLVSSLLMTLSFQSFLYQGVSYPSARRGSPGAQGIDCPISSDISSTLRPPIGLLLLLTHPGVFGGSHLVGLVHGQPNLQFSQRVGLCSLRRIGGACGSESGI